MLAEARELGVERWIWFLEPVPDQLRDDPIPELRRTATRARAAYGPEDYIRDALPAAVTEPFLDALDRLLRSSPGGRRPAGNAPVARR